MSTDHTTSARDAWARQLLELREDASSRARARELGLEGLRAWSCDVLLQSGTGDAAAMARSATEQATTVAGWCLDDGAIDEAVQALDLGRGLVLYAATVAGSVPRRLRDAGREDLAAEWQQSVTGARNAVDASDLRHRVLRQLAGDGTGVAGARLLRAPSSGEIRAALATMDADALVYLVAGAADRAGYAVVVRPDGAPRHLPLPSLHVPALGRHLDAVKAPRGGDVWGEAAASRRSELARLCGWAWPAAMGPLLDDAGAWGLGRRPPRIVLVPTGGLGLVPWHAASRPAGSGVRYAVEDAVLSYAPSARLLCEMSARKAARRDHRALVVGNPSGDLPSAEIEARAVLTTFYPDGFYVGIRSPGEVLAHMGTKGVAAPPVAHFACRAVSVAEPPAGSYLELAGTLTVEMLLEHARQRDPDQPGAMVVLSACATDVSGDDYDEALTIATGFLVAEASTVVGSLWPVPDRRTATLMFMFHHHLNRMELAPADALRAAQLWMLDPDRMAPRDMPQELARHVREPGLEDPYAWAAFTHRGR
jgi:hypothetical protein